MKHAYFTFDIEADGPCPGLFSMISFAVVPVDAFHEAFYGTLAPLSDRYVPKALAVSGFTREETLSFPQAEHTMLAFREWAQSQQERLQGQRMVLVGDNPGFDFGFLTYYCERFGFSNPFGHSARRLGDLFSGWKGNLNNTRGWQKWTRQRHTHHAKDDATKLAQGFLALRQRLETRPQASEGARSPGSVNKPRARK